MLTVALGIFNATVARTILSNSESNIRYETGATLVLKEQWESNEAFLADNPDKEVSYTEPDFSTYESMKGVKHATKVYCEDEISTSLGKKMSDNETETSLMAIDTKNFGLTVSDFDSTLLPTHLNNYLNAMAGNPDAILLSMNFQKKMGVKLGDKVTYTTKDKKEMYKDTTKEKRDYKVMVLINGGSASASEVLAAALKESYGATLLGTKSYGKGTVQDTSELESGGMIKYTTAYWLTPKGVTINEKGLTPDIEVTGSFKDGMILENDVELQTAINNLK